MTKPMNDFASSSEPAPRPTRHRAGWRRASLALTCVYLIATASGCSMLSSTGRALGNLGGKLVFWSDDESAVDVSVDNPGGLAGALLEARENMRFAPNEPYWPYHMGELYARADSTTKSIVELKSALEIDPSYAPAVTLLSKLYYQAEIYDQAVFLLNDFLAKNPTAPDPVHAALALNLEALGELEMAQAALDKCRSNSREVHAARTFVSLRDDDLQSALDLAEEAVQDNPNSAANQNNYGIALLWSGRPVEAREAFLTALKLDEQLPGALYNMAIVDAFYFFDKDAGREWFVRYQQVASTDPDDLASEFGVDLTKRK